MKEEKEKRVHREHRQFMPSDGQKPSLGFGLPAQGFKAQAHKPMKLKSSLGLSPVFNYWKPVIFLFFEKKS